MTVIPPDELLNMYASGIFPMAERKNGPIMLYSPDPRTIINPVELHVSHSLAKTVRSERFEIRIDTVFEEVMRHCAAREDTWISEGIVQSYLLLHHRGFAHSVEAWRNDQIAGGLYGVSIAGAFFGESMFYEERDASKVALVALCHRMTERGMPLLDVQYTTPHLRRLGAYEVSRLEYLRLLDEALRLPVQFT